MDTFFVVSNLVLIFLAAWAIKIMKQEKGLPASTPEKPLYQKYWPIPAMFVIMLLNWIPYFVRPKPVEAIESIGDERIQRKNANDPHFQSFITVTKSPTGIDCPQENVPNETPFANNRWNCFAFQKDGAVRVVWIFDHPLQYSGVKLFRKGGAAIDYSRCGGETHLQDPHNQIVATICIDKAVLEKEPLVVIRAIDDATQRPAPLP